MSSTFEKENLEDKANFQQTDSSRNLNQKSKRPAQTLYIPKHMRNEDKKSTLLTNANSGNGGCTSSTNRCNSPIMNDPSIIGYITDGSKNQPTESISSEEDILNKLMTLNISKPMTNDQDKNYKEPEFPEHKIIPLKQSKLEADWFDIEEDRVEVKKETSTKIIDYLKFEPHQEELDEAEYGHILEIYDFPIEFKNENIFSALKEITGHVNFDLKWVDDTHCLGVFENATSALNILKQNTNPFMKTRPLSKATAESKRRAQRLVSSLRPYKPRPQTTSFVASRLIGASLGLNSLIPKEKLKLERKKIDNARDTKKRDREIREAVWEGK